MKRFLILLVCGAAAAIIAISQAPSFHYVLNDSGAVFSDPKGFIELLDDGPDNARMLAISGPFGRGSYVSGGVTPYYLWANGIAGQTANVPYLRPDGTVGTLVFNGGLFREALNGNVPTEATLPSDGKAEAAVTAHLMRRGYLRENAR